MKFQPILNFESLTPQTTKGDLIGRTSAGATRVPVGTDNLVLTADSSQALGVKWASAAATVPVNTLTGATTLPATSQIVLVSGTTFPITFPNPSGNSGLQYIIQKADSGLVTPISVTGTGVAGITFQTQLESYSFYCDGATYWPFNHYAQTPRTSYTPTLQGFTLGVNPYVTWMRDGRYQVIEAFITVGSPTASEFRFGLAGDLPIAAGVSVVVLFGLGMKNTNSGPQSILGKGGNSYLGYAEASSPGGGLVPANANSGFSDGQNLSFTIRAPMAGWGG